SRSIGARTRANSLAPAGPLACLHRALREKQKKDDEKDEVSNVIEIDHALGEAAELIEQRERAQQFEPPVGERRLVPVENPEKQQQRDGAHSRHHLALAQRRNEHAARDKRASDQQQAQVARDKRKQRKPVDAVNVDRVEHRQHEHHDEDRDRREILAAKYFTVAQRIGVKQFDRAELPLFGEQPHRNERQRQQQAQPDIREQQLPVVLDYIAGERDRDEENQVGVRIVSRQNQEHARQHIDQGKGEVRAQFLARHREHPARRKARPRGADRGASRLGGSSRDFQRACTVRHRLPQRTLNFRARR